MPSCWHGVCFGFCLPLMDVHKPPAAPEPDPGEGRREAPSQGGAWHWVGNGHRASGALLEADICLLHAQHRRQGQQRLGHSFEPLDISLEAQILGSDFSETSHRFWGWIWQHLCPLLGGGRRLEGLTCWGTQQPRALTCHEGLQHVLWKSPVKNAG